MMIDFIEGFIQDYYIDPNAQTSSADTSSLDFNPDITLITKIVAGLRLNRPGMIQTWDQYAFVFSFVSTWYQNHMTSLLTVTSAVSPSV